MTNLRTCVVCRAVRDKSELLRVTRSGSNYLVDGSQTLPGRGAYVCNSPDCIQKACKTRAFNRSYKAPVSENLYIELIERAKDGG